jgi:hypothetical protein
LSKHLPKIGLAVLLLGAAIGIGLMQHKPFFWDTIQLGSKHAHWYYEQQFQSILLPPGIDSGHPPFFGMYLAAMWTLFGKSLAVSHWSMLPFVWGIILLLFPIGRYFSKRWGWLFPFVALANPVLLTQMLLISPDAVLICGFLLTLYGILYQRLSAKVIGAILLAMISTRGMMVVVALFLFEGYQGFFASATTKANDKGLLPLFKWLAPYVPAGLIASAFLLYHYLETGWIGYHADSQWAPSFERAGFRQMLKNTVLLAWRLLDFGLVFVWLALGVATWRIWRKQLSFNLPKVRSSALLFGFCTLLLSLPFLFYTHLHQHRYLLPIMASLQLLSFTLVGNSSLQQRWKIGLLALMTLGPISGHFWVYPDSVAQGWDSSLAHLPYYGLKTRMIDYLEKQGIPLQQVGTAFPEIGPQYLKDLSGREAGFMPKDFATQRYILYSNIMNDFSEDERQQLQENWRVVHKLQSGGVHLTLYAR